MRRRSNTATHVCIYIFMGALRPSQLEKLKVKTAVIIIYRLSGGSGKIYLLPVVEETFTCPRKPVEKETNDGILLENYSLGLCPMKRGFSVLDMMEG